MTEIFSPLRGEAENKVFASLASGNNADLGRPESRKKKMKEKKKGQGDQDSANAIASALDALSPEKRRRRDDWIRRNVPQPWTADKATNAFSYRPRVGDVWEIALPHKRKRRKRVGRVRSETFCHKGRNVRMPYVDWERSPKGRYTGVRVKWLLKYGKLIARLDGGNTVTRSAAGRNAVAYAGGKNGDGVFQKIINLMPPHRVYVECFLGGGAILRNKRPAERNVGIEIDPDVWLERWHGLDEKLPFTLIELTDAVGYLRTLADGGACWDETTSRYKAGDVLIYLDPPYLMETRSTKRPIYAHEFHTEREHRELLEILLRLPCKVMISGYPSRLYDEMLAGWRCVTFTGNTRGGPRTECVWLNFPEPAELHDYRYLGETRRERQDIKRQKARWLERLARMPSQKRYAMLAALDEFKAGLAAGTPETPPAETPASTRAGDGEIAATAK